jgi:hypothetical protein
VRSLRAFLTVLGATALGAVWGCIAVALLGAFTVFRAASGEDWGTSFGVMYSGLCCGASLGALAGFMAAMRIARAGGEDWSPVVWIGVASGVALGPLGYRLAVGQVRLDLVSMLLVAVVAAMSGTVGGMLAATGEGIWRRASGSRGKSPTTGFGLLLAFLALSSLFAMATLLLGGRWTGLQLAVSILIGVPILCGSVAWLGRDEEEVSGHRFRA